MTTATAPRPAARAARAVGNQPAIAGAGAPRPPMGRPGGGPGFMGGMSLPAPKPKSFKASFRRLLGELRPERSEDPRRARARGRQRAVRDPRARRSWARRPTSSSPASSASRSRPGSPIDQADRAAQRGRPDHPGRACSPHEGRRPRPGHRLHAARPDPVAGRRPVHLQLGVQLGPGLHHGRRHPAHRLPPAPAGRREARPPAAGLLRPPVARRHPERASPTTSTTSARRSSRA